MSLARIDVWSRKMAKPKLSKTPEPKSLPPTTEVYRCQNYKKILGGPYCMLFGLTAGLKPANSHLQLCELAGFASVQVELVW